MVSSAMASHALVITAVPLSTVLTVFAPTVTMIAMACTVVEPHVVKTRIALLAPATQASARVAPT